jgi:small subunit ribosomal protein S1
MVPQDDFASLMQASSGKSATRGLRKLRRGEIVEGTVVQIGQEAVYVDVGTPTEARVDTSSLLDDSGKLRVALGDKIQGTVVDARMDSPVLAVSFGRNSPVDREALNMAYETKTPIFGKVTAANKGGLEVDISGNRAFCPSSHVELSHVEDLSVYEGQELEFQILELRDGGRNVVVSRRALLEQRRQAMVAEARGKLSVGSEVTGTVTSITKHGVVVDLEGVSGFVHVSELANHRVDRPEDVVQQGASVTVRVLGIEPSDRGGERIRLSMRQSSGAAPAPAAPAQDEVLTGTVLRAVGGGLVVRTAKGEGFVPVRELELAPGADYRRAFPPGKELKVVMTSRAADTGRMTFSVKGVADVEDRANYRSFANAPQQAGSAAAGFGSLGDLLKEKFGQPASKKSQPQKKPARS